MAKKQLYQTNRTPRSLLVGINAPGNKAGDIDAYYEEFVSLVKTNGIPYQNFHQLKLRSIDPAYFITRGKLDVIKELCEKQDIDLIVISETISPRQERNLEDYLEREITDRTRLILEIFEKAAHSAEGKAQVEIAVLKYQKSRLAGKGIHLSQQTGAIGLRGGPGETLKEQEKRHINQNILRLKKQLKKIQQSRDTQRKRRLDAQVPHMCLIGYTNAGKSTILNALTKSDVLAQDKLFATLDTTTRTLFVSGTNKGILSDTVGFIQNLPPHLIEAFKSTLSELEYADLLIHVVNVSDLNWQSHIRVVQEILDDLGIDKPVLYVFNKIDKLADLEPLQEALDRYQPHVLASAQSKDGLQDLKGFLENWEK